MTEVNQFVLYIHSSFFKPVTDTTIWLYQFNQSTSSQLPSSPITRGWRRMTSEDIPSALALINKWSSQFEIRQVFDSEELDYNFLSQKYVVTYVVDDEDEPSNLTALVSFEWYDPPLSKVCIKNIISTQPLIEQLINDVLVCAKEYGAYTDIGQHNIKEDILKSLSFQPFQYGTISFYNYKYHQVSQPKFWFHTHR